MQVVSFETAKRLKEAGFPCPAPVVYGQMYYSPTGGLLSAEVNTYLTRGIFAPIATDLIPAGWRLSRESAATQAEFQVEEWICSPKPFGKCFQSENPAEAAAMAWLHVNRNQSNV